MGLGPACSIAFYGAMVGYYTNHFHGSSFYIGMQAAVNVPFLMVLLLQHLFDQLFDEIFSPKYTYMFRTFAMQLVLASVVLTYLLCPQSPPVVLGFGFLIGLFSAVLTSSCTQMVSAMNPSKLIWLTIGNQLGAALPALVLTLAAFGPESAIGKFRSVLATPVVVCILAFVCLVYLHSVHRLFDKTYRRLSYDLPSTQRVLMEGGDFDAGVFERQLTETEPLEPNPKDGSLPRWVWYWYFSRALDRSMSFCLLGLITVFGSTWAQHLILTRMVSECFGRLTSMFVTTSASFRVGPFHKAVLALTLLRIGLFSALLLHIIGTNGHWRFHMADHVVVVVWVVLYVSTDFSGGLVDVTCGEYVKISNRKKVARLSLTCQFSGLCVGLLASFLLLFSVVPDADRTWPSSGTVIRK
eukprot:gnl/TRDRNA2_/TRDRNA2_189066_c0_seq1.p1 gnl/TRDRNA2_/TRDRNA2_189066_c0~~gnl/TRDRNA2_/TRDRNA2_189066_c0_seq1.p1  ORF type:complete len:470 (-),score=53.17 gnl/TRDRNA2_/TRDRNA2_189066_c0_seq1:85-1317(-)